MKKTILSLFAASTLLTASAQSNKPEFPAELDSLRQAFPNMVFNPENVITGKEPHTGQTTYTIKASYNVRECVRMARYKDEGFCIFRETGKSLGFDATDILEHVQLLNSDKGLVIVTGEHNTDDAYTVANMPGTTTRPVKGSRNTVHEVIVDFKRRTLYPE